MRVLSFEESKQITIKFLKHFGVYDKEKVEKYFTLEPKKSFLRWIYKFFTTSLPKRITIGDFFPPNIDIFKKHYGAYLMGSLITFEDEEKCDKFYKALEKTLNENNLSLFYAMSAGGVNKQIISFKNILEGIEKVWPRLGLDIYIFSDNFLLLLKLIDGDGIVIYGSQKIINDIKKNYPEHCQDFPF